MEIKTETIIYSTPEKIWAILTQFENYPNWNPFIKYITGNVKVNNKIEVKIETPGTKGMVFKPKVLAFETNEELRWLGHLLFPGIFDGEHLFKIIDNKNGSCTFTQVENFKGLLVPFLKHQLNNNTKKGFEKMNEKLKEIAESNQ